MSKKTKGSETIADEADGCVCDHLHTLPSLYIHKCQKSEKERRGFTYKGIFPLETEGLERQHINLSE